MAKKGRRRQDHLARKAQTQGYHARSVYKLEALDEKFQLFPRGGKDLRVLDLGAAPGSWTQYAVQRGAAVVAVDLQEMQVSGADCRQADFTEPQVVEELAEAGPFDLVLSDAAPATTGNKLVDTSASEALVESALANLERWLVAGGSCAFKLFQGGGEQELLAQLRSRFEKAALHRPKAVRSESFEGYLVGVGFRG
ncbi:MAG: RlmE family RNA methyltransferase [Alkalispirochaeta sp.]